MFSSSTTATKQITPTNNSQPIDVYPLTDNPSYSIQVTQSIQAIKAIWDQAAPKDNIFLQSAYLEMLELFPPEKMSFRYVLFYKNEQVVGIAYNQVYRLKMEDSINENAEEEEKESSPFCILTAISKAVKKWFIKQADFNLLICGNLLLTGEYGFHFNNTIEKAEAASLVQDSMESVQELLDKENTKVSIQLIKDHPIETAEPLKESLEPQTFHPFKIQPSMVMDIPAEWESYDDYLAAMRSKYRVRARRARKKGKAIERKELTLEEIEANEEKIHALYKEIADGAGFNAFVLHKKYFTELKRHLQDDYKLIAYYIDGEFVAFYTAIFNYEEMDAHFLGVDSRYNRKHQVYLNILHDLVDLAINHRIKRLDFARTALEIKSSVGAVAQDMLCFFRHRSTVSSKFLQLVFDYLNPKEEWQPRSPFKKG